jgi:proteasome accessory factor C
MIPYIRQHPNVKISKVAKVVGCKPAELLEDLNERVLMCGVPPYLPNDYIDVHVQGDNVSIRFAEHFKRPVRFTMQEALALKVMLSSVAEPDVLKGFLAKLDGLLSFETKKKVEKLRGRIGFLGRPLTMLQEVERALQSRKEIEIEYYTASRDAMTQRTIHPYGTIFHHGY